MDYGLSWFPVILGQFRRNNSMGHSGGWPRFGQIDGHYGITSSLFGPNAAGRLKERQDTVEGEKFFEIRYRSQSICLCWTVMFLSV